MGVHVYVCVCACACVKLDCNTTTPIFGYLLGELVLTEFIECEELLRKGNVVLETTAG